MKNREFSKFFSPEKKKVVAAAIICIVFLITSLIATKEGNYLLWLLPVVLSVGLLAFYSIDILLLLIVFLAPLSVQLRFIVDDPPFDFFLPTELMLFGVFLIVIYKLAVSREFPGKLLHHPVTIVILLSVIWGLITSITGVNLLVSIKSVLSRLWFICGFYLLAAAIFQEKERIRSYLLAYISGMVPVIIYFLIMMNRYGLFNQGMSHSAIRPFFNDHTSFGAALAFCLPVILFFLFKRGERLFIRLIAFTGFVLFFASFIFSYSRAAWLSVIGATIFVLILLMKIPWKLVFASIVLVVILLFTSWSSISEKLNSNKQVSTSNLVQHLQSVSNITSDVSNSERINRWKSALRMFREKPFLGWGPGAYQFEYAPYQRVSEKTEISTNFGDGGNAHSEYLGSLVDSGVPALIFYLLLISIPLVSGIRYYKNAEAGNDKLLVLFLMAGLVTYVIHGFLNNFLDTDKISAPFWGYIAAIVVLDLSQKKQNLQGSERA
jgi:putative inorganic carbon (HCO3(-)) transporter